MPIRITRYAKQNFPEIKLLFLLFFYSHNFRFDLLQRTKK